MDCLVHLDFGSLQSAHEQKFALRTLVPWVVCAFIVAGCWGESGSHDDASGGGSFVALGSLPGYALSEAAAVSPEGSVVVGTSTSASGFRQAFRWNAVHGMAGLGFLGGGSSSSAKGVSANGDVVIGDADGGAAPGLHAFRWTSAAGVVALPGLHGSNVCSAAGVSAAGGQIAGTCSTFNNEAFRWTELSGTIGLGRFGSGSNAASNGTAISADGKVIGGAGHPVLVGAIVWDADNRATVIGNVHGDTGSVVSGLSADGRVAVGTSADETGRMRAFRWDSRTGALPLARTDLFYATFAAGVSADGRRIVGWATTAGGEVAIVWKDGNLLVLSDMLSPEGRAAAHGWTLRRARAISHDAHTIVGHGTNPAGLQEAWVVTLPD